MSLRVGIDYRFLAVGPGLITRGMCRFTQQQLREVLAVDDRNEYVLLCNQGTDLSLIAPEVRNPENVEIRCYAPPRDSGVAPGEPEGLLTLAEHYQDWIWRQGLDVYHSTTPFLFEEPILLRFDACPMVATFYDLIPLLFPSQYLDGHPDRDNYMRSLGMIRTAGRLLAISDSARDDAATHLGIPRDRIDRAWPIPDRVFRPLPAHLLRKLLLVVRSRVRLPERYVLTVSHLHHSKNLLTLLRGYARLPRSMRAAMPLVLCCHLDPASEQFARRLAGEVGVGDDLVVTGHVTDEELCAMYNQATLVVHPSRYEGFGLPVVEAMCCGAPVVTTAASSLPEVAGDAAVLVDPEDPGAFADAIAELVSDPSARETLRRRGFEQAKQFDAAQLARATLDSYRRVCGPAGSTGRAPEGVPAAGAAGAGGTLSGNAARLGERRPRVALWTPLPPQLSGISDYSEELLSGLAPHCDLEVFVDGGYLPAERLLDRYTIHHHSGFRRRAAQEPFDAIVYEVGGSLFHDYMSEALAAHPGIVVLHDLIWSIVLYAHVHLRGDDATFHRQLAALHGHRALERFLELDPAQGAELWDFLSRHPMLEPVIEGSLAQVVLVPAAADELRGAHPGSDPRVIPMGVTDPYEDSPGLSRETARCQLGLDPDAFVAGAFGIVHPLKRLDVAIRAIARLAGTRPDAILLIVGRALEQSHLDALVRLADELGVTPNVRITGHVPRHRFDAHLAATDAVVNLRVPSHIHMSATLMRGIAAGKPNVLSDLPFWRHLPDSFCLRVPCDEAEEVVLVRELRRLAADPGLCARMSAAARAFYEQEGTIERMAARYLELIREVTGDPAAGPAGRAVRAGPGERRATPERVGAAR